MAYQSCNCQDCQNMCATRPCWGTPADVKAIIEAGFGASLMKDYWVGNFRNDPDDYGDVIIISPAIVGHEGEPAPYWPSGACTFFKDGLCQIHDIKPAEGKAALCKGRTPENIHEDIARSWDTPEGRAVVELFYEQGD